MLHNMILIHKPEIRLFFHIQRRNQRERNGGSPSFGKVSRVRDLSQLHLAIFGMIPHINHY